MSNRPTWSDRQTAPTRSPSSTGLDRRRLLLGGGSATALALAGCLDSFQPGADDEENGDDSDEDDELIAAVDTYLEAAAEEDVETMGDVSHELNPLNPELWVDEGWEFEGGDGEVPDYDADVRTADGAVEDVYEVEGAEFWFDEVDLEAELEGESIGVVVVTAEDDGVEESGRWVFATDDGEWQLLVQAEEDDTPDDPEEAFGDPVEDEDDDVVVEIDWEYERPDEFGFDDDDDDNDAFEVTQAEVALTDSPGLEAHTVRAESTIAGGSNQVFNPDREPGGWSNSSIYVEYDPDGDEITVIAVAGEEEEETVVHREQYLPDDE